MQKATFPCGGFVIHKISHLSPQRISAWFDREGKLIDAQFMPSERAVKNKSIILSLESVGRAWRI